MHLFKALIPCASLIVQTLTQSLDGQTVIQDINDLATAGGKLTLKVQSLNATNLGSVASDIVEGFQDIIHSTTSITIAIGGTVPTTNVSVPTQGPSSPGSVQPFADEALEFAICGAFNAYVVVHQQLHSLVIDAYALLSTTPVSKPLGEVLKSVEELHDAFSYGLINLVPVCGKAATNDKDTLDQTLTVCVGTYNSSPL
ncbi:MAG: hypothetical protein Q9227_001267 [Pyrenula ochraceoflavens]